MVQAELTYDQLRCLFVVQREHLRWKLPPRPVDVKNGGGAPRQSVSYRDSDIALFHCAVILRGLTDQGLLARRRRKNNKHKCYRYHITEYGLMFLSTYHPMYVCDDKNLLIPK